MEVSVEVAQASCELLDELVRFRVGAKSPLSLREPEDDWGVHFVARDSSGSIVAAMRINLISERPSGFIGAHDYLQPGWQMLKEAVPLRHQAIGGNIVVSPSHRGGNASDPLIQAVLGWLLSRKVYALHTTCIPDLLEWYRTRGFRPYGKAFYFKSRALYVPLVALLRDAIYLRALAQVMPGTIADYFRKEPSGPKHEPNEVHFLRERSAVFATNDALTLQDERVSEVFGATASSPLQMVRSIAAEFRDDQALTQAISRAIYIVVPRGEHVFKKGESVYKKSCLLLLHGQVVVRPLDAQPRRANPGQPLGEVIALGLQNQSADIVAESECGLLVMDSGLLVSKRSSVKPMVVASEALHPAPASGSYSHADDVELARLEQQGQKFESLEVPFLKAVGLKDGDTVLDVGCGLGTVSRVLARCFPGSRIVGVDPNGEFVEKARAAAAQSDLGQRVSFLCCPGHRVGLGNDQVDFAYARFVLQHVPEPKDIIREMCRLVRLGGQICLVDVDDGEVLLQPEVPGFKEMLMQTVSLQAAAGGDRFVGRKLAGYLTDAGLSNIQVHKQTISLQNCTPEEFFYINFSFRLESLKKAGQLNDRLSRVFGDIQRVLAQPGARAEVSVFGAIGIFNQDADRALITHAQPSRL